MYKIINDILSEDEISFIEKSIFNERTPWVFNRFQQYKNPPISEEQRKLAKMFQHPVFKNGEIWDPVLYEYLSVITKRLGATKIHNMVFQLMLVTGDTGQGSKHVDMPHYNSPYFSTVYYVNTTDGPTILYNDDGSELVRCDPERGKLITFDGNIFHCSSKPTEDIRCILNIVWE